MPPSRPLVPFMLFFALHQLSYMQHERGGQLCGQRRRREFLCGAQARAREPASVSDESRNESGYLFDYIERWHNPRQRRRLDMQQPGGV